MQGHEPQQPLGGSISSCMLQHSGFVAAPASDSKPKDGCKGRACLSRSYLQDLAARASQPAGAFGGESLLLGPSLHLGLDSETQGWLGSQTYPPPVSVT